LYDIAAAVRSPAAGVHYNDVAEINNIYALGVADPMLQTMESVAVNTDVTGSMILNVLSKLQPLLLFANVANNLQNYAIPLPGGFWVKVGSLKFQLNQEPEGITFAGDPFASQCLYADCKITLANPAAAINNDQVL